MSDSTRVAELEERVATLERQMEGMAEVVSTVIYEFFGCRFYTECGGSSRLEWEEVLIPAEQNDGVEETIGWWFYQVWDWARKVFIPSHEAVNA